MSHYGNYKPSYELGNEKSILGRLRAFWIQKCVTYKLEGKSLCMGLKKALSGGIIAILIGLMLGLSGCRTHQPTVIEKERIVYVHSDSTIIHDSTIIIPVERYVDIVPQYDTLLLRTELAESKSWLDTTNHLLRGNIRNLKAVQIKYIEVERVVYNDSVVEKEVPVPYPVIEEKRYIPTFAWICMVWAAISIVLLGIRLYLKFFKP